LAVSFKSIFPVLLAEAATIREFVPTHLVLEEEDDEDQEEEEQEQEHARYSTIRNEQFNDRLKRLRLSSLVCRREPNRKLIRIKQIKSQ